MNFMQEPQSQDADQDTLIPEGKGSCTFPGCKYPEEREGYCLHHVKQFGGPKPDKKPKPIPRMSKKTAAKKREYRKIVNGALESDPACHVNSPDCTGYAEGMNHKQKRSPKNLTTLSNLEHSCNACNLFIELNPTWAEEQGHQVSRFKKLDDIPLFISEDQLDSLPEELYIEGNIKLLEITINNKVLDPAASLKVRRHSETLMWGYPGVGSLQTSLAILMEYMPADQALNLYKKFEINIVDSWPFTSFEITLEFRESIRQLIIKK